MASKKVIRKRKVNNKKRRSSNQSVYHIGLVMLIGVSLCVANVMFTAMTGYHFRSGKNVLAYKSGSGTTTQTLIANRGYIYDRNKEIIAQDIESYDLVAIIDKDRINEGEGEAYVSDYKTTSEKLAPILNCDSNELLKYFNEADKNKSYQTEFGSLGKDLSAEQKGKIEDLKISGLEFNKSTTRVYPTGIFASQLIGYADYNYDKQRITGEMGIEYSLDKELSGKNGSITYQTDSSGNYLPKTKTITSNAVDGDDVYLTIDKNVQVTLEKALSDTMESNGAQKAWGVVMEAKTGRVLAQAGYPTFDLNTREGAEDNYYNLPSEWAFEPGSVMKAMTYSAAMNENVYDGSATFSSGSASIGYDGNGNLVRSDEKGGSTITTVNDALGHNYGVVNFDDGLIRSLNTGIVSLVLDYLGTDNLYKYLKEFGFGQKIDIKAVNESKGVLADNSPLDKVMTGFGQASTVNSYQLIQAYSAIFGDGKMVTPYVIDKIVDPNTGNVVYQGKTQKSEQIISEATCQKMQALLKRVVSEDYGTARQYKMSDVTLMAKTGTGQIVVDGTYSSTIYTSSVMAAAPADNPQIIVYYAFQSSNILSYNTGYFQDIVREALVATRQYTNNSEQTIDDNGDDSQAASYEEYEMPEVTNHTLDYVNKKMDGMKVNKVLIGDGNSIVSQYPKSASTIISNQNVFLLTDGTNISIPNMSGWSRKDIKAFAKLAGINVSINGSGKVVSQSVPEGTIINNETKLSVELK